MFEVSKAWKAAFPGAHAGVLVIKDVLNPASHAGLERCKDVNVAYSLLIAEAAWQA